MLTFPPSFEPYRGWVITAVALSFVVLLLVIPASRRALRNYYAWLTGFTSGFSLSKRPVMAARTAVGRKVGAMQRNVQTKCYAWMSKYTEESRKLMISYRLAERTYKDTSEALLRAQAEAANDLANGLFESSAASHSPISRKMYYAIQGVIGVGDVLFTYFAFELWNLPTILLVPLVLLLGGLGVVIGHFCGQAIVKRQRASAIAFGIGGVVQCIILGATRFAYLLSQNQVSKADTIAAIAAFGIPLLLVLISVIVGAQLRLPTPLELARQQESAAEQLCEITYANGIAAAEQLNSKMKALRSRMLELVEEYHRGFNFGWREEPLEFPAVEIDIPEAAWPPPAAPPRPVISRDAKESTA